ncbi:MAG: hypothetical protein KAY24_19185 [Candidatus Eisenbacteria sp.]|nr:hypothetical protein [Candidatus Eisenbacteria bacterium]
MTHTLPQSLSGRPLVGILAFIIVLLTMPLGHALMILTQVLLGDHYQYIGALGLGLLGAAALLVALRRKGETAQTFLGFLAGIFLWTGFVEFSFVFYAHHLAIAPMIENGEVVTKPEYLLLPSSIGLFLALVPYFLLNPHTRCMFFAWFRRRLHLPVTPAPAAGPRNYAAITAMETIFVLWAFYILLMIAYDKAFFGDRHPFTYAVFAGSLLWSIYLITRLLKYVRIAPAIRYAVPTVIIFWTSVEILGRWDLFREIWIEPTRYWLEVVLTFAALLGALLLSTLVSRGRRGGHTPPGVEENN